MELLNTEAILNDTINRIRENAPTQFIENDRTGRELYILYRLAKDHKLLFDQLQGIRQLAVAIRFLKNRLRSAISHLYNTSQFILYTSTYKFNDINILSNYYIDDFKLRNPLTIRNQKEFYSESLQTYLNRYFNEHLAGIRRVESIEVSRQSIFSNRYNIYSRSIRMSQIQAICEQSDRLRQIYNNLKFLSDSLTPNELQKLYSSIVQSDSTDDLKLLVLKFNMDTEQMSQIRLRMPLIYKLLKSARRRASTVNFTHYEKLLIRDVIKEVVHSRLTSFLSSMNSAIISEAISIKIETAITEGEFIDPYSLLPVKIKGSLFIEQLVEFIQLIVQNIKSG